LRVGFGIVGSVDADTNVVHLFGDRGHSEDGVKVKSGDLLDWRDRLVRIVGYVED
jgi:hypothetical protein